MELDETTWNDSSQPLFDRLRADQVKRWERGERVRVEWYLREVPELRENQEVTLDLIYGEMLLEEQAGLTPQFEQYSARFPDLAEMIRRQFAVHEALSDDATNLNWSDTGGDFASNPPAQRSAPRPQRVPVIPGYEILGELGRGGMGVVYQARHVQLNRIVALKVLRDRALADEHLLARFRAEAEAVARLQHPHIVQIYDFGEHDGCSYLSLEYVSGGNLESWTIPPLRSPESCARMMAVIADAVEHAHQHQLIHRDLKPANILLTAAAAREACDDDDTVSVDEQRACQPKIADFGLVKSTSTDSGLTQTQAIMGTGAYMSPEQAWGRAREVGPPTDVHALGVILYELLTGRVPFRGESFTETLDRVRFETAIAPSRYRGEIPPQLDAIVLHCLEKSPENRYASAQQLADDLRQFVAGDPLSISVTSEGALEVADSKRPLFRLAAYSLGLSAVAIIAAMLVVFSKSHFPTRTPDARAQAASFEPPSPATRSDRPSSAESTVPAPARTEPSAFAFLVGVRSYTFGNTRLDLDYTESDVDDLSRVLLTKGFPRSNIRLLTQWSEADNAELAPTADNIRRQLPKMLASCLPGDLVLIALTGVGGESGPNGTYCYLAADAQLDEPTAIVSLGEIYRLLEACPAQRKIVLVDTCQTANLGDYRWPIHSVPPGVAALFACSPRQASYEHPTLGHGVFSYHVMRGMEGAADVDGDGTLTLAELFQYAHDGVHDFLDRNLPSAQQTPMMVSSLDPSTPILPVPGA